jgi:hypothetical protein
VYFASSANNNYINIPVSTFLVENQAAQTCDFMFTSNQQQKYVFGGMFFEEFYGQLGVNATNQTVQIFVSQNSQFAWSYIGNQTLPEGKNPFKYYAGLLFWQWLLIVVGGLLVLILIIAGIIYCC